MRMIAAHGMAPKGASRNAASLWRAVARAMVVALCLITASAAAFTIRLAEDERVGGHTLERHVGLSEADLRRRLADDPRLSRASSFPTQAVAEAVVNETLRRNAQRIAAWLRDDPQDGRPRAFHLNTSQVLGHGVARGDRRYMALRRATVVLRKTWRLDRGFYVLTAYPTP